MDADGTGSYPVLVRDKEGVKWGFCSLCFQALS